MKTRSNPWLQKVILSIILSSIKLYKRLTYIQEYMVIQNKTLPFSIRVSFSSFWVHTLTKYIFTHIVYKYQRVLFKSICTFKCFIYKNSFQRNQSIKLKILMIHQIIKGVCAKNLEAILLFIDFFKAFDSIHRKDRTNTKIEHTKDRTNTTIIWSPQKSFTAKMIFYKNNSSPSSMVTPSLTLLLES